MLWCSNMMLNTSTCYNLVWSHLRTFHSVKENHGMWTKAVLNGRHLLYNPPVTATMVHLGYNSTKNTQTIHSFIKIHLLWLQQGPLKHLWWRRPHRRSPPLSSHTVAFAEGVYTHPRAEGAVGHTQHTPSLHPQSQPVTNKKKKAAIHIWEISAKCRNSFSGNKAKKNQTKKNPQKHVCSTAFVFVYLGLHVNLSYGI